MEVRPIDANALHAEISKWPESVMYKDWVQSAIATAPTLTSRNEWVSVEKIMPPEHEPVLCIVNGKPKQNITLEGAYQLGSWNKTDGWIIDEYLDWEDADVSCWMPLPTPPGKDNNVPTKAPNEPLTLERLREMDGEPVWVTPLGFWALVIAKPGERVKLICNDGEVVYADKEIEFVGPVYRCPPQEVRL